MPCGGIYPCPEPALDAPCTQCFYCRRMRHSVSNQLPNHFVEEWNGYLHAACVEPFLGSPEGRVVLAHHHSVVIKRGDQIEELHAEGS